LSESLRNDISSVNGYVKVCLRRFEEDNISISKITAFDAFTTRWAGQLIDKHHSTLTDKLAL